jgi:signal transduction histidine kinase
MAGLLYYLHHLRIQRLLHVEKVRTRLARDLHDDMGSTLSTINILSNMALKKADSDHKTAKEYMSRISNNSSRMMEAMDDIVWSINPVNDNMRKVAARMKEFAGNSLEAQDINYIFHIDEDAKDLGFDMETRRGIFLIFKEAINNILKYAQATEVSISMQVQKKWFVITIADNGIGFDPNKQVAAHRGNGLKNMHKRAEGMNGGKLNIETALGKGTTLLLKIPL